MFGRVRYVGSSQTGEKRPNNFLGTNGHDFKMVGPWLRKCGGSVPWNIIEEFDDEVSSKIIFDTETKWIQYYKSRGEADKNHKMQGSGGNGGATKGRKQSLEEREIRRKAMNRPDVVAKLSFANTEAAKRPDIREKIKEAQSRPETNLRRSLSLRLTKSLPHVRAHARKTATETNSRPEVKKAIGDAQRKSWTPERRLAQAERMRKISMSRNIK